MNVNPPCHHLSAPSPLAAVAAQLDAVTTAALPPFELELRLVLAAAQSGAVAAAATPELPLLLGARLAAPVHVATLGEASPPIPLACARNSARRPRASGPSLNAPVYAAVAVTAPGFSTPRIVMHMCLHVIG